MLLSSKDNLRGDTPTGLDSIHNFYQQLVFEQIEQVLSADDLNDIDYIADVACVALNHLPPKYIRHNVDMAFYLSIDERSEMENKVVKAVEDAINFVSTHGSR